MIAQSSPDAPFPWPAWVGAWAAAYLIGSIPIGLLMARSRGVDIREHGSGNIGATNVGRVLGRKLGVLCFALDALKGLIPTLAAWLFIGSVLESARWWISDTRTTFAWLGIAAAAVIGHIFPVWLKFRGGKGVATGLGAMLGAIPVLCLAAIGAAVVWFVSLRVCRYVGLSSCIAAASLPVWVFAAGRLVVEKPGGADADRGLLPYFLVAVFLSVLVIFRHRANLVRAVRGTEPRVGRR